MATDLTVGVTRVDLRGSLTLESVPTVRQALLRSFAQQPEAVIADVSGLRADTRDVLSVFPTAVRVHGFPAVALLLCGASAELSRMMAGRVLGEVPTYESYAQALLAVTAAQAGAPRRMRVHLEPDVDAPGKARQLVSDACAEWGIGDLAGPATLIVSELVANAVQHARTGIDVTVALRGDFLHINVRDGSPKPVKPTAGRLTDDPAATHGRGLALIGVYATGWGTNATADGKIVWATLRAAPVGNH